MEQESRIFNPLDLAISRSHYRTHPSSMGDCLAGRLIPAYSWNVLPGSEYKINVRSLFKMSTPVYPTMDYLYADIGFFFIPYKLLLSRRYGSPDVNDAVYSFEAWIGAQDNKLNMPIPASGLSLPMLDSAAAGDSKHGLLFEYLYGRNYTQVDVYNALPAIAYFSIFNDDFREPNIQDPVTWSFSSGRLKVESGPSIYYSAAECATLADGTTAGYHDWLSTGNEQNLNMLLPLPVSVFHGYFGSLLPWPQRNLAGVSMPLGSTANLIADGGNMHSVNGAIRFGSSSSVLPGSVGASYLVSMFKENNTAGMLQGTDNAVSGSGTLNLGTTNLVVDLSNATAASIEQLRAAIIKQHWNETLSRSGNRYDELEYGTFGVRPKDSGCCRPQYLGGKRIQLNMDLVASTNGGTTSGTGMGSGSLGNLGAFSHTNDDDFYFYKGFDNWGIIMCVFTIRHNNLYASGANRHWMKRYREEFYWPQFAGLGNESIIKKEICLQKSANEDAVLGYQEYAEEWREDRDMVTGLLCPDRSLGFMTYGQMFTSASDITLATLLDASRQVLDVDRTLQVSSATSGFQFVYQFTFDVDKRVPVGKYSVPGVGRI